jgi:hypothetical protein
VTYKVRKFPVIFIVVLKIQMVYKTYIKLVYKIRI